VAHLWVRHRILRTKVRTLLIVDDVISVEAEEKTATKIIT
jgi:hypothetical protein